MHQQNFRLVDSWGCEWVENSLPVYRNMPCIDNEPLGIHLPRKTWTALNLIRTKTGKCTKNLHRWGKIESQECDCQAERQTICHITEDYPRRCFDGSAEFKEVTENAIKYINKLDIGLWLSVLTLYVLYVWTNKLELTTVLSFRQRRKRATFLSHVKMFNTSLHFKQITRNTILFHCAN